MENPLWPVARETFLALVGEADEEPAVGLLRAGFAGENGRFRVLVQVDPHQIVAVFALSPIEIPPAQRDEAVRFVAGVNQRQVLATLDIHADDGSVRARCALDSDGIDAATQQVALTPLLENTFWAAVTLLDLCLPALVLLSQGKSAKDALTALEQPLLDDTGTDPDATDPDSTAGASGS
jgi:hypothetical protein